MSLVEVDRWLDEEFPKPWNRNERSYVVIKEWLRVRASLPEDPAREAARVPTPATFAYGGDPWRLSEGELVAKIRDGYRCRTCGRVTDRCDAVPWTSHNDGCGDPAVLRTLCAECWTSERRRLARELCDAPAVRQAMLWEYRPCTATAPSSRTRGEG